MKRRNTKASTAPQPAPESSQSSQPANIAEMPAPRELAPDSAVAAIRAQLERWGAALTVSAMLQGLQEYQAEAPAARALEIGDHRRISALRRVAG